MSTLYRWFALIPIVFVPTLMMGCVFPIDGNMVEVFVERNNAQDRYVAVNLVYDVEQIRKRDDGRPAGLVVFSMGYTACIPSVTSFGRLLAERGFVFAVPDHDDVFKVCEGTLKDSSANDSGGVGERGTLDISALAFFSRFDGEKLYAEEDLETFFRYRDADLYATIEYLTRTNRYEFGSLSNKPVILVGYSLGAWNALNVAGAGTLYPELRWNVDAVICENPFFAQLTEVGIRQISCPVFYVVGSEDPCLVEAQQMLNWSPTNSSMVEIAGADHYIFAVDLCSSPFLGGAQPGSCSEADIAVADKTNALMVEFISNLAETAEVPQPDMLAGFDPNLFSVVGKADH